MRPKNPLKLESRKVYFCFYLSVWVYLFTLC